MLYKFHDALPGKLDKCQISNNDDLELVVDLGDQPLCDALITEEKLNESEKFYPLKFYRSKSLGHGQLDYIVPGEEVYFPEYPYRPGITSEVKTHHSNRCNEAIKKFQLSSSDLIVDIGSNDGTLLSFYKEKSFRVLGVEPTMTAQIAEKNGIETIQSFFDEKVAEKILTKFGQAKLVTATNVFAHMATMGKVTRGIKMLIQNEGYFVLENHYILNILHDNQYDTIYHEHIRSYSLTSLIYLFELYKMKVIDAEIVDRYGGTIRVTVTNDIGKQVSTNVIKLVDNEKKMGLFENLIWKNFKKNIEKSKSDLMELALDINSKGQRLVGKSCPGRCSTLINYTGLGVELMPYIAEQPTSLKLGKYLPGKHIPIVDDDILFKENPDFVIIFAWHYGAQIANNLRGRGLKSKFILPLPQVSIME